MHILYLQQELILPEVAGNNRCWQFARTWVDQGHQVTFITGHHALPESLLTEFSGKYPNHFRQDGIDVHVIRTHYSQEMRFARRLVSFAEFFRKARKLGAQLAQVDVVLAYSAPLSVGELGRQLAERMKRPFFFEVADVWPDVPIGMKIIRSPLIINWLNRRTDQIYRAAECIYTFSDGMREQVCSHNVPEQKVVTVPNGINLSHRDDRDFVADPRRKTDDSTRVYYTGTIGTVNDVGQLVRAMHVLQNQGRLDISCVVVGRGNEKEKVQSLAKELHVKNVHFEARVIRSELPNVLRQADIGVSTIAPFPVLEANAATKFYDYLSLGLPVVINHGGWQADYLRNNHCGLSSKLGDVSALADNIRFLADHPDVRSEMGHNGAASARRDFDREKLAMFMIDDMLARLRSNPRARGV